MNDTNITLADLLSPTLPHTVEELEKIYPPRESLVVTRVAPSPTGFLHLGTVYTALLSERIAHLQDGIFYLRIEDTDDKREIEWAVEIMINGLQKFGILLDEGPIGTDGTDIGNYGPYTQSKRGTIYQTYVKDLVRKGLAYPCFLWEEETAAIRAEQTAAGQPLGIYGSYSTWRSATMEEMQKALAEGKKHVIRFRSHGQLNRRVKLHDEIHGEIEMADNFVDVVLLKQTGIPTYHLAHVVDDHLMRTTHVTRGDEWIPSYPLHIQLATALGFTPPKYIHIAPLCKVDGGNKRKLSKRKDAEANIEFFFEQGYPVESLVDYMFNIMDSRYEWWRKENPDADYKTYPLTSEHLPLSGALFDIQKLDSVSNTFLSRISTADLMKRGIDWAETYDTELAGLMKKYPDTTFQALDIERHTEKDPRRFTKFSDIRWQIQFFYDEIFENLKQSAPTLPESITPEIQKAFIEEYVVAYNADLDREAWFEQLKEIAHKHGFARNGEEWKIGDYRGKVGDIAMMLRILLCASIKTPDLCLMMRIFGKEKIIERLKSAIDK